MTDTLPEEFVVRLRQEGRDRGGAARSDFLGLYPHAEAMQVAEGKAAEFDGRAHIGEWGLCITVHVPVPSSDRERIQTLREAYHRSRFQSDASRDELRDAVVDLIGHGMAEAEAARIAGVDRMTVRKWNGKR